MQFAAQQEPALPIRTAGGSFFAENPEKGAVAARIFWKGEYDPTILRVDALPTSVHDPEALHVARLAPWLTIVPGRDGGEHVLLSDGWRRIRLDVMEGTLGCAEAVRLRFHLEGLRSTERATLSLRRLIGLHRHRRFGASLFPCEPKIVRWLDTLRVHDALRAGASHREIAVALFGAERAACDWNETSDSLRSRVRRLAREAARFAAGSYRRLLFARERDASSDGRGQTNWRGGPG